MREPGRVMLGIVAASITGYVLFGFAFAAIITVGTRDMSVSDGLGGATYLLVVYAALAVPIAVVTCAVVFGTTYGALRVLRFPHGIAFPAVGAAVLLAFGIWDHQGPLDVSLESAVAMSGLAIAGAASGAAFWWCARPPQ